MAEISAVYEASVVVLVVLLVLLVVFVVAAIHVTRQLGPKTHADQGSEHDLKKKSKEYEESEKKR